MVRLTTTLMALALAASALAQDVATLPYLEKTFASKDKLEITADLYLAHKDLKAPFILLCHQANWSRGEYREIAPKLNKLGFNCMAIDQRSGKTIDGVDNKTAQRASKKKLGTSYLDARPDIIAALKYARKHYAKGKLILWGSSYSSSLALQIAGAEPELCDGVCAFAPGEYFGRFGGSPTYVIDAAKLIKVPSFITSAQREHRGWKAIHEAIPTKTKDFFVPKTRGNHGSRALWTKFDDSPAYWKALKKFCDANFPRLQKTKASSRPTTTSRPKTKKPTPKSRPSSRPKP